VLTALQLPPVADLCQLRAGHKCQQISLTLESLCLLRRDPVQAGGSLHSAPAATATAQDAVQASLLLRRPRRSAAASTLWAGWAGWANLSRLRLGKRAVHSAAASVHIKADSRATAGYRHRAGSAAGTLRRAAPAAGRQQGVHAEQGRRSQAGPACHEQAPAVTAAAGSGRSAGLRPTRRWWPPGAAGTPSPRAPSLRAAELSGPDRVRLP
jgi:hypothetical protein